MFFENLSWEILYAVLAVAGISIVVLVVSFYFENTNKKRNQPQGDKSQSFVIPPAVSQPTPPQPTITETIAKKVEVPRRVGIAGLPGSHRKAIITPGQESVVMYETRKGNWRGARIVSFIGSSHILLYRTGNTFIRTLT